ncbi:MAG: heterodisulfide reductase-related iron-sulfur binding cluster, partial [Dehalococcoidia bacterium]|nr:heterodisulfide reductase-related iron-sulfur binding cluster [Dehalococcoidia bacterium]
AGLMHTFIYGGFVILTIVTTIDSLHYWAERAFGIFFLSGPVYLGYSLVGDVFGVVLLIGLAMAWARRRSMTVTQLEYRFDDNFVLSFMALVALSGYLAEAPRIALTELRQHPEWAIWSPVGMAIAFLLEPLGTTFNLNFHKFWWFAHMFSSVALLGYIGYSKLGHMLFGPLNIFFANPKAGAALKPIPDFEGAIERGETLGVASATDLTWKQILDTSACIRCGRCHAVCPATESGKPLSPKKLILDIRQHLLDNPGYLSRAAQTNGAAPAASTNGHVAFIPAKALVGETIEDDVLWSCTTCRACMEECPMFIEHIPTIVDMRRNLVMMESRFSPELQRLFNNLEAAGNPFRQPKNARADWAKDLGVKIMAQSEQAPEVLFWVGCAGSYDERNQKVARAFARTMKVAGVDFAILGREETCTGDPARRCGNEYLFQILAQENIETLNRYNVKTIVTACAHCYNTLKNEYPQFGGHYEVMHHSEFINDLLKSGRIKIEGHVDVTFTYHDPCYIGRHNGVYDAPREVLNAIPGLKIVEMPRNGRKSFCCGGGGGHSFMEVKIGKRINHIRTEEAAATTAEGIAASCPFCHLMFEDGVKVKGIDDRFVVRDIVELVDQALNAGVVQAGPATGSKS